MSEPWPPSWQPRQSVRLKAAWTTFLSMSMRNAAPGVPLPVGAFVAWHLRQNVVPLSAFTLFGRLPPCGSWHSRHLPSATGACFTGFVESESASWHSKQTFSRGCEMSPAKSEECAAWQERQLPCRITVWTDFD